MGLFLDDGDVCLYQGDVRDVLAGMPDGSVDCVVTSPPYWGLRDYGTGAWQGGEEGCNHAQPAIPHTGLAAAAEASDGKPRTTSGTRAAKADRPYTQMCGKCGATRVDQQLGLEATPDEFVANMVAVFREVRRVLAPHGTCWVNLGSSFADKQEQMIPAKVALALQAPYYTGRIRDERERIWLAATVEAEGCMFIHRRKAGQSNGQGYERKNDSYGAGLEVASTDRVIVERCLALAGIGSICEQTPEQNERRKQTIYRWNVRSNECRWIIRELYPHLIAKQHEARLLLGCPSSGEDARKAHESLKALHQGQEACIDFREPEGMWEGGWFLRSEIIWAKLCRTRCRSR
jgi:DNA methylase